LKSTNRRRRRTGEDSQHVAELIQLIAEVSTHHLMALGHFLTNVFFGLENKSSEEDHEINQVKAGIVRGVSQLIFALCSKDDNYSVASCMVQSLIIPIYYGLFVLSNFAEETQISHTAVEFGGVIKIIKESLRKQQESQDSLSLCVQTYILVIKIFPNNFDPEDLSILLRSLKEPSTDHNLYRAICQLLVVAFDRPKLKNIVANQKTLLPLSETRRFLDSHTFTGFINYSHTQIAQEFISWMWTLATVVHSFDSLKDSEHGVDSILKFVNTYRKRILAVLNHQILDSTANQRQMKNGEAPNINQDFKTMAYVEELELTLTIVSQLMSQ
jgi:hypothetical protein